MAAPRQTPFREVLSAVDTPENCRQYLRQNNLLAAVMVINCARCGAVMHEARNVRVEDAVVWRCPERRCRKTTSVRKGSFFEGAHLPLQKLIELVYWWAINVSHGEAQSQVSAL